jgi:Fe-S cluster assembly iron-binding protein IscA
MLQMTTEAAELIREARDAHGDSEALLRVSARHAPINGGRDLLLGFVAEPQPGDEVSESEGIRLCFSDDVASTLDGKVLDVADAPNGRSLVVRAA